MGHHIIEAIKDVDFWHSISRYVGLLCLDVINVTEQSAYRAVAHIEPLAIASNIIQTSHTHLDHVLFRVLGWWWSKLKLC